MLHPLALDVLTLLLPLCLGGVTLAAGYLLFRWPKPIRAFLLCLAIGAIAVGGSAAAGLLPGGINSVLSRLGGGTVLLSWAALLLLGVVWGLPKRSLSTGFLAALAVVAFTLLVIETGGRLWWRFPGGDLWQRTANADGCLRQSSGVTCSPAAGVMLLHHHGIAASEGEMAYLANSSFFGTDAHSLCRALAEKVQDRGWTAEVRPADYETCIHEGWAFVAHVRRPDVGGHAVFVERVLPEHVQVIDPLAGMRAKLSRAEFEQQWDGVVIRVISGPP
jgi:hypothetical protein